MSRKYISQFYDINKNTQAEQVLENMSEIDELKQADLDLQSNIDDEAQTRNDADSALAEDIGELKAQVDALGNVFTLKGSVATLADLPVSDNNIGDVYYVESENVGYVWIDDNGVERWEQLGLPIDLSEYVTSTDLAAALEDYQGKLTAGDNITILGDVISAQVPDVNKIKTKVGSAAPSTATEGTIGQLYYDSDGNVYICYAIVLTDGVPTDYMWEPIAGAAKQNKLTAGTNITIDSNNVISSSGGTSENMVTTNTDQTISGIKTIGNTRYNRYVRFYHNTGYYPYIGVSTDSLTPYFEIGSIGSQNTDRLNRVHIIGQNSTGIGTLQINKGSFNFRVQSTDTTVQDVAFLSDISAKVPDAPDTDGTYTLKCVVSSGVKTYQWVLDV